MAVDSDATRPASGAALETSVAHRARVASVEDVGGKMSLVTLALDDPIAASYEHAGQYTRLELEGESGYFVLACAPAARSPLSGGAARREPGPRRWQILVRGGGVADRLIAIPKGTELRVSPALGAGFPNQRAHGRPLLVVVGGTGFAAARALVPARIAGGDAARTTLFLGVRREEDVPLRGELEAWAEAGVGVTICLSRPNGAGAPSREDRRDARERPTRAIRAHGYVQDVLRARAIKHTGPIFVVGPLGLIAAMRSMAHDLGASPSDVHTNV